MLCWNVVDTLKSFGIYGTFGTVPEYRHKGLASATLSELYRGMKPLGATHMTGGDNLFYAKIGYQPMLVWTEWEKEWICVCSA